MKVRKKPVVVDAIQFLGEGSFEDMCQDWGSDFVGAAVFFKGNSAIPMMLTIKTLEGDHRAFIGEWIIRGVKGEFYPCKKDIFEATYEDAYPKQKEKEG